MGLMYDNGYYVNKNRSKALEFYKLSANQGYAKAQYNLANAYLSGDGVQKDINLALELYEKAAIQNLSEAQYNLANIYSDGSLVKQDNKKLWSYTQK